MRSLFVNVGSVIYALGDQLQKEKEEDQTKM